MSVGGQSGNQFQSGSSNQSSQFDTTGSNKPITTGAYDSANAATGSLLGTTGLTPGQQDATDYMKYQMNNQPINNQLGGLNDQLQGFAKGMQANIPGVSTSQVGAQTGSNFMAPYQGAYANDVLNPSLAAFDQGTAMQDNAARASRDAGSAFGDRAAVADSVRGTQNATARGALAGQITGQGYQSALGAGQADAGNALSASNANAGYGLQASQATAQNALMGNNQILNAFGQVANNLNAINSNGASNAAALYGMSGGGVNSLINYMGANTPAFGSTQSQSGTGSGSGSQVGSGGGSSKGASIPIL